MAYPTRRALRLAGQEDEQAEQNGASSSKHSNGPIHSSRRRDSRDETGSEDEEQANDLIGGLRRSKRVISSSYRSINKGILVAQAIPLEEMTDMGMDMYSRVKSGTRQHFNDDGLRVRRPRVSNGAPRTNGNAEEVGNGVGSDNDDMEHEDDEEDVGGDQSRGYNLRRHRAQPQFFVIEQSEPRRRSLRIEEHPHRRHSHGHRHSHHHSSRRLSRRQLHSPGSCSTTPSSSSGESDIDQRGRSGGRHDKTVGGDAAELRFERRRVRSMATARREVLPVNFTNADLELLGLKDRIRAGASVADIDPMYIDRTTSFEQIGGLENHIRQLKEMIVFPLLYPEMFSQFSIVPPRGVLFFGPPGTGKTLLARALANECSKAGGKRVAFFMRRGADCLSKWVGESERQLRLLFDQAYQLRPSIIFFDEVDGLAPIRSSRQDQIHSSIVSTLLALMDGLDSRQEVVVIGATNRIDSIDPALRRPGRFDREFLFRLPNRSARKEILNIHTRSWQPQLSSVMVDSLSERTVGFSGADLRGLCTEAVLNAVRRRYPQIYNSRDRLLIDPTQLRPCSVDFNVALASVMPSAARARQPLAWPLSEIMRPLLGQQLQQFLCQISKNFPLFSASNKEDDESNVGTSTASEGQSSSSSTMVTSTNANLMAPTTATSMATATTASSSTSQSSSFAVTPAVGAIFRPRILLCGRPSQGHVSHIAPAALHCLEDFQIHALSMGTIFGASDCRSPEDAVQHVITEAIRTAPSVLYLPDLDQVMAIATPTLRTVLQLALESIKPDLPILLLATIRQPSSRALSHLPLVRDFFRAELGQIFDMRDPDLSERRAFFSPLFKLRIHSGEVVVGHQQHNYHGDSNGSQSPTSAFAPTSFISAMEQLPLAPVLPHQVSMSEAEKASLFLREEVVLREMRVFLRDILNRLLRDRRFGVFARPVDKEDAPDYYDIITNPMDLSQMMSKIDRHEYGSVSDFVSDIDLIAKNALEYNPETDTNSRTVRHRACALRDACASSIDSELDPDFERQCLEIKQSRFMRGIDAKKTAPAFIYTPAGSQQRPVSGMSNGVVGHTSPQPHPASATVALVQMQQALTREHFSPQQNGGEPPVSPTFQNAAGASTSSQLRPRELRSGNVRPSNVPPPPPSTQLRSTSMSSGCKRRRVDASNAADEPVQLPSLAATHAVICGTFHQQQQFDALLERLVKLTDAWNVDELHRVFMLLSKLTILPSFNAGNNTSGNNNGNSFSSVPAADLFEKYESIVNNEHHEHHSSSSPPKK